MGSEGRFNVEAIRAQFPALHQKVNGKVLTYLDNAASSMKPQAVIDALVAFYSRDYSNVHRGVHTLSQRATDAYEQARRDLALYLAAKPEEVVFTRGTTESLNLVANAWGARLRPGDEVVLSGMEHHSQIVPWQMACQRSGAVMRVLALNDLGAIADGEVEAKIGSRTRVVALVHISNALGTVNDVAAVSQWLHTVAGTDAVMVVDGAQGVPHGPVDPRALGADFYAFSGHKMMGPTGIGALWGKAERLAEMPPWQGGGDMIRSVSFEGTTYADPPARFEAGTPAIGEAIGLGAAARWMMALDWSAVEAHEDDVLAYGHAELSAIPGLRFVGSAARKKAVLGFVIEGVHPHDLGTLLDLDGVALRVGQHCAEPVMRHFGVSATTRASLALYSTRDEIDRLVLALHKACRLLR